MQVKLSDSTTAALAEYEVQSLKMEAAIGDIACGLIGVACKAVPVVCMLQPQICLPAKAVCALAKLWCRNESGSALGAADGETLSESEIEKYCKIYKGARETLKKVAERLPGFLRTALLTLMTAADAICGIGDEAAAVSCSCGS